MWCATTREFTSEKIRYLIGFRRFLFRLLSGIRKRTWRWLICLRKNSRYSLRRNSINIRRMLWIIQCCRICWESFKRNSMKRKCATLTLLNGRIKQSISMIHSLKRQRNLHWRRRILLICSLRNQISSENLVIVFTTFNSDSQRYSIRLELLEMPRMKSFLRTSHFEYFFDSHFPDQQIK